MDLSPIKRNRRGVYNLTFLHESSTPTNPVPQNLANCNVWMRFKTDPQDADGAAVFTKEFGSGITITSESGGLARMVIEKTDTESLDWTQRPKAIPLYFDTELEDSTGAIWPVKGLSGTLRVDG